MSVEIDEAAARWHMSLVDDDMDWEAFSRWLEADPRHREALNAMALLDERIEAARPVLPLLLPDLPSPVRWALPRRGALGAIAAALVVAVLLVVRPAGHPEDEVVAAYRTVPGQTRTISLPDGSSVVLSPGSVLHVPSSRDDALALEGRAYFDVRHDETRPLTVRVGGYTVRDVGTRFDVAAGGGVVRVAVAEGEVAVATDDRSAAIVVVAGQAVTSEKVGDHARLTRIDARSVGAWRSGPLVYDDVPLALVVSDVARTSGRTVTIAPSLTDRRFSGLIAPGDAEAMTGALGALTGLTPRKDGDAIRLDRSAGR